MPQPDPRKVARTRLRNLTAGGAAPHKWYRFANLGDGTTALYLYSEIGDSWWGDSVSAKDFVAELQAVDTARIEMHINSPGGDVWDGIAIMNALRAHPAKITTIIDGIAASAASFIAMAGDEVVMMANSEMMIHDASGVALGDAALMRQMAEDLDRESDNIAAVYAARAGGTPKQWRDRMVAETWFSDKEAVEIGLADRIQNGPSEEEPKESKILGAGSGGMDDWWWDALPYRYAGREKAPAPSTPRRAARLTGRNGTVGLKDEIAKRLGIRNEDVSDEDVIAALDEALEEGTAELDDDEVGEPGGVAAEPQVAGQPENQMAGETVRVDKATWEQVQADARRGRDAAERADRQEREALVAKAIRIGQIPPSRKKDWLEALEKDPTGGNRAALESLAPGLIPVNERGHDAGEDSETADPGQVPDLQTYRDSPAYKRAWR